MHPFKLWAAGLLSAFFGLVSLSVQAQVTENPNSPTAVTGSLVDLVNSGRFNYNRLERLAAVANQATYNELLARGCGASATGPSAACPADAFRVFSNVRELVHTANELLGPNSGPSQFSLGLDGDGLGFALRWTAAEELSAPGSVAGEFANAQIASLMSRITALRYGATGFSVAGLALPSGAKGLLAKNGGGQGGGAGADAGDSIASRWGGFFDGAFGWGSRDPSEVEDAFDFDGTDIHLGVDYRFTRQFVFGGMFGYSDQEIDFDSTQSVVDGGIKSKGYGLMLYGLYEWDGPYVNASLGVQNLSHDSTRVITYPSFNINTESTYATAYGSTDSRNLSATLNGGWPLSRGAFGFEPYVRAEYRKIDIDAFDETSVHNSGSNAGQPAGFDFSFGSQSIKSLDTALGVKFQYVFTPSFGVIVPFARAEYHHNFETDPFTVTAVYRGSSGSGFALPSDERDSNFTTYALGASMVLKFGWQAFFQYQRVAGLSYLDSQAISGGIRGEF